MKRMFICAIFLLSTHLYAQTAKKNSSKRVTDLPAQKNTIKNQPLKTKSSYLDSLKMLTDTVTFSQVIGLVKLNFYSGTIYFAGTYFENVATLRLNPKSDSAFHNHFARCAPGSKLSFDNVTWKDEDGHITGPLTKLFILK
jgi:hypothetical protein